MFNFFKKKSEIEVLQSQYEKLMQEAFILSKTNRTESDKKTSEANSILDKINSLTPKS
jgi:hypothetical protein